MANQPFKPVTAIPSKFAGRLFPVPRLATIITVLIVLFLVYAFFSRITLQFYASILFLFYSITKSMWLSVVGLGIFQTLLMIPFRVVNLKKSANIKEFIERFQEIKQSHNQHFVLKKNVLGGRRVALYYIVNFFVFLTSYVSIGRLFLTDFYLTALDPKLLYSFVPYPDYPLLDRFFKIPYVWFTESTDLGMNWVWIIWGVGILLQLIIYLIRSLTKKVRSTQDSAPVDTPQARLSGAVGRYATGYLVVFLLISYLLIRNFPVGWNVRVFSGDVALPNRTFNTVTAIVTFGTLVWINLPKIKKKVELARESGMDEKIVSQTEKALFKDTLQVSAFVGLGAFFITNQIPSAFELSIFTLEMISLLSPLTLDPLILASANRPKEATDVPALPTAAEEIQPEALPKPLPELKKEIEPSKVEEEIPVSTELKDLEKETAETQRPKVETDPVTGKKKMSGEIQF